MTPLYPAGVYAPLPRFSKKTQTNIAPSVTRNTASARCSRDAPIISVAWSSKGSLLFPCFGEPSPRYSARHVHSGSSHRFYALRRREPQQVTRGRQFARARRLAGADVLDRRVGPPVRDARGHRDEEFMAASPDR